MTVSLRHITFEVAALLYKELGQDPDMYRFTGWNPYATLESAQGFVGNVLVNEKWSWIIEDDGESVGTIGAYDYDADLSQAEIGYSVFKDCWGRGYATAAAKEAVRILFEEESLKRVIAWTVNENPGSVKALKACGMELESVEQGGVEALGQVYDKLNYVVENPIFKRCFEFYPRSAEGSVAASGSAYADFSVGSATNMSCPNSLQIDELLNILRDKKLFLFDLDGTLGDTEPLHWSAYNQLLVDQGIELKAEDIERYKGNPEFKIYDMIRADYGALIDDEDFLKKRLALYLNLVAEHDLQPFKYVERVIQEFPQVPKCIVSSQRPEIIEALLNKWGMSEMFPAERRVSCKIPFPEKKDVYGGLVDFIPGVVDDNYSSESIVVFEDSKHAIDAALAVGMTCVRIRE